MHRTKALEILAAKGIVCEVCAFKASSFTAEEVAESLGIPLSHVYKTLVVRGKKGEAMAVVPGDRELNLKKLAAQRGEKSMELLPLEDLHRLTGYLKGGCSPLGSKKAMPLYLDRSAAACERISVSAGLRGVQMMIKPADLLAAAGGEWAELV